MLTLGTRKAKIYIGDQAVKAVYAGVSKVYPNNSLAVTPSIVFDAAGGTGVLVITCSESLQWNLSGVPDGWSVSAASGTGTASVTVTAPNNTTAALREGEITVTAEDMGGTCSVTQAAGTPIYGDWYVYDLQAALALIPASGGSSAVMADIRRDWTWNGVAGSEGFETSTAIPVLTGGADGFSIAGNVVSAAHRGTTEGGERSITVTGSYNNSSRTMTVSQQANGWYDKRMTLDVSSTSIGASGGTVECRTEVFRGYTSGDELSVGYEYGSIDGSATGFSINGKSVTADHRGTTEGTERSIRVAASYYALTAEPPVVITQQANEKTPEYREEVSDQWTYEGSGATRTRYHVKTIYLRYLYSSGSYSEWQYHSSQNVDQEWAQVDQYNTGEYVRSFCMPYPSRTLMSVEKWIATYTWGDGSQASPSVIVEGPYIPSEPTYTQQELIDSYTYCNGDYMFDEYIWVDITYYSCSLEEISRGSEYITRYDVGFSYSCRDY